MAWTRASARSGEWEGPRSAVQVHIWSSSSGKRPTWWTRPPYQGTGQALFVERGDGFGPDVLSAPGVEGLDGDGAFDSVLDGGLGHLAAGVVFYDYSVGVSVLDLCADPFGSGACLAESSACENEPGVPVFFGWDLGVAGAEGPVLHQLYKLAFPQATLNRLDGVGVVGERHGFQMLGYGVQTVNASECAEGFSIQSHLMFPGDRRRLSGTGRSVRVSFGGTLRIRATACVVQPATQSRP